jgi:hypothetical protein
MRQTMQLSEPFTPHNHCLAAGSALLRQRLPPEETPGETTKISDEEEAQDYSRIRCPLCRWQPDETSRWSCNDRGDPEYFFDGCGTTWNTFSTRGLCPGCGHQWRWTKCLKCKGWSLHEDWYAQEAD